MNETQFRKLKGMKNIRLTNKQHWLLKLMIDKYIESRHAELLPNYLAMANRIKTNIVRS